MMRFALIIITLLTTSLFLNSCASKKGLDKEWEVLLDKDLSKWDKFIGVPHYTLCLEGYEKGNGIKGTPIGLNNDPLNVLSAVEIDGDVALKISGQIYGGISTKKEFENYHLTLMYK